MYARDIINCIANRTYQQ